MKIFHGLFMVFIGLVGVAIVAGIVANVVMGNEDAVNDAQNWSRPVPGATGGETTGRDTDGDGYISCTVFRQNAEPLFIECASTLSASSGCRAQQPKLWRTRY